MLYGKNRESLVARERLLDNSTVISERDYEYPTPRLPIWHEQQNTCCTHNCTEDTSPLQNFKGLFFTLGFHLDQRQYITSLQMKHPYFLPLEGYRLTPALPNCLRE
jgi:hypothetical protein